MAALTFEQANELLQYESDTGKLFWLPRPARMFTSTSHWKRWNTRFANKEAFVTRHGEGYRMGVVLGHKCLAHRIIWLLCHGAWPLGQIDHINGDRTDNRIANLRDVSNAENMRNTSRRSDNTSGVTGVYLNREMKKWAADIRVDGRTISLGLFETINEAATARSAANSKYGFTDRHGRTA
ncbi:HNH endonuclease protein [Rhizobium phage RHph_X2_25]|nr:HNH endonuclease protein [Rhizobium phage RHph_X2_25]